MLRRRLAEDFRYGDRSWAQRRLNDLLRLWFQQCRGPDPAAAGADADRVRAALRRLTSGRWATAWRLLSAVAIVAIGLTQIDLAEVGDALSSLSVPLAALSWAMLLAGQVISGVRWE